MTKRPHLNVFEDMTAEQILGVHELLKESAELLSGEPRAIDALNGRIKDLLATLEAVEAAAQLAANTLIAVQTFLRETTDGGYSPAIDEVLAILRAAGIRPSAEKE